MAHKQPGSLELHSAFASSSQRHWEYPLQLLTKWKDPPSSISSSSHYANHHLLCQSKFLRSRCNLQLNGKLLVTEMSSSSGNKVVPTYTCCGCFWKAGLDPAAEPYSVQTEAIKMKSWCSLIKGITAEHCLMQSLSAHSTQFPLYLSLLSMSHVFFLRNTEASPWQNSNSFCSHNTISCFPLRRLLAPL